MKKLLAITVIFALVAGAAFAETSVGGEAEIRYRIDGSDAANSKVTHTGNLDGASFFLKTEDDDGKYGGMLKFAMNPGYVVSGITDEDEDGNSLGAGVWAATGDWNRPIPTYNRMFAWWQPIPQLKLWMGKDGDGMFNPAGVTRWGFHKMDRGLAFEGWEASTYLMGNWDETGVAIMIYPIEGLEINLALATNWEVVMEDDKNSMQIQAAYNLEGVGKFTLTFQPRETKVGTEAKNTSKIGLVYNSASFVEGLSFEVGLAFDMTEKKKDNLKIGLGAEYQTGDFGVKLRVFMDPETPKGTDTYFKWKADVMPYYSFGDIGTIYVAIGVNAQQSNGDIGFYFNPYFKKNVGPGELRFGGYYENSNGDKVSTWRIGTTWVTAF